MVPNTQPTCEIQSIACNWLTYMVSIHFKHTLNITQVSLHKADCSNQRFSVLFAVLIEVICLTQCTWKYCLLGNDDPYIPNKSQFVTEGPRDASCLSVVSFNSTICRVIQHNLPLQIYN